MMRVFILFLFVIQGWLPTAGQPCVRNDFTDKRQRNLISQFIKECEQRGFLTSKLGFIHLAEWTDQKGQLNWQMWAKTSWRQFAPYSTYKHQCTDCLAPFGWTKISGHLIIRYKDPSKSDTLTSEQASCLRQLLTGSVTFESPPAPHVPAPIKDSQGQPILGRDGKPIMTTGRDVIILGNGGGNNTHVTFKEDGSIEKGLSL